MLFVTFCPVCATAAAPLEDLPSSVLQIGDSNMIPFTCDKGHHFVTVLSAHRYEILFEYAVLAFADGYYREAVSSAATALERAYEVYTKAVVALGQGMEGALEMWKSIGNLSERQLGAFVALYTMREGVPPLRPETYKIGARNAVQLRNDAVHKGYIPTDQEARAYLAFVLDYLQGINDKVGTREIEESYGQSLRYSPEDVKKYEGLPQNTFAPPLAADYKRSRRRDLEGTIKLAVQMRDDARTSPERQAVREATKRAAHPDAL